SVPTTTRFSSSRLRRLTALSPVERPEDDREQREGEQDQQQRGDDPRAGAALRLRRLRNLLGLARRDDHRVERRHAVQLVKRLLVELALTVFAEDGILGRLLEWLAGVLADLEEDDGDVVLAAALVRRADERLRRRLQIVAVFLDAREDDLVLDHRGEPVRAEHEQVAGPAGDREGVGVDVRVGAERAGDHRALGMGLGVLGGELAAADELGDERVVLGHLLELAVANQVGPRVADVAEGDRVALDERDGHRRPHPGCRRVLARALIDAPVRLLDQLRDAALAAAGGAFVLAHGAGGEARRELAGLRAAHAVGDREERRRDDVFVLVSPALLAGVRAVADLHDSTQVSYLSSVSPPRRRLRRRPGGRGGSAAAAVQTRLLGAVTSRTSIPSRLRGVACDADLEAVAALPLRPSKHGSSMPSRLVPQFRLANADDVAGRELARAGQLDPVQIGAVRGADVLHPDAVAARLDAGVLRRGVVVAVEGDVVLRAAADGQRGRVEHPSFARLERGAADDDQAADVTWAGIADDRH